MLVGLIEDLARMDGRDQAEKQEEASSVISIVGQLSDSSSGSTALKSATSATNPAIDADSGLICNQIQVVNTSLCSICSSIFDGHPGLRPQYTHHKTMKSLRAAAFNGCPTCILTESQLEDIWHGSDDINLIWCFEAVSKLDKRASGEGGVILTQSFTDNHDSNQVGHVRVRSSIAQAFVRSILGSPTVGHETELNSFISSNTGSVSTFHLAKKWITTCIQTHKACKNSEEKWYPTRLLDISQPDICLVITQGMKADEPYGTLSHCWGSTLFLSLTTKNIQMLREGFRSIILPKTFKHAIQVARWLDLKYLWIDSLCIVQDSEDDWLRESAMMEDVYKHSYCNIAGTPASNGSQGLFFDRDQAAIRPMQVTVSNAVRLKGGQLSNVNFDVDFGKVIWSENINQSPLLKRAWVVQERLLAPRVLHFGKKQVIWECNDFVACETFPQGFSAGFDAVVNTAQSTAVQSLKKSLADAITFEGNKKTVKLRDWWWQFQNEYMSMSLTNPQDRLPAMSGITKSLQRITGWQYFAGHWKNEFGDFGLQQLLWSCTGPSIGASHQTRYQPALGPTWSWISVYGKLEIGQLSGMRRARVFEVAVNLKHPENPYGEVTGGELLLTGYLKPADFVLGVLSPKSSLGSSTSLGVRYWNKYWPGANQHIFVYFDERVEACRPGALFCLPLVNGHVQKGHYNQWGLVLKNTQESQGYTRIGMFRAKFHTTNKFLKRQKRIPQPPLAVSVEDRSSNHSGDRSTTVVFSENINYDDATVWETVPWQTIKII